MANKNIPDLPLANTVSPSWALEIYDTNLNVNKQTLVSTLLAEAGANVSGVGNEQIAYNNGVANTLVGTNKLRWRSNALDIEGQGTSTHKSFVVKNGAVSPSEVFSIQDNGVKRYTASCPKVATINATVQGLYALPIADEVIVNNTATDAYPSVVSLQPPQLPIGDSFRQKITITGTGTTAVAIVNPIGGAIKINNLVPTFSRIFVSNTFVIEKVPNSGDYSLIYVYDSRGAHEFHSRATEGWGIPANGNRVYVTFANDIGTVGDGFIPNNSIFVSSGVLRYKDNSGVVRNIQLI